MDGRASGASAIAQPVAWNRGYPPSQPPVPRGQAKKRPIPRPPKRGCRGRSPRRGYRGTPPVPQNVGGWARWDNGVRRHKPPLLPLSPCQLLLAKSERLCYSIPRKWAASPLRFLEACRIQEHWGPPVNPCGRGLGRASPAAPMAATKPALGQGAPGGCSPSPAPFRGSAAPERTPL